MRTITLTALSFIAPVAAGLLGVQANAAAATTPSDFVVSVNEQRKTLRAAVARLDETLQRTSDPQIAAELIAALEDLDLIEEDLSDIVDSFNLRVATSQGTADVISAMANLAPRNGSGVKANIDFVDDGTTLQINGTASGLDAGETYLTLIYDNGSVPGGPNACTPTIFDPQDPDFLLGTMVIGFWEVDAQGQGTLSAINTNSGEDYVPLDKFRSTSVRLVIGPPPFPGAPPETELDVWLEQWGGYKKLGLGSP